MAHSVTHTFVSPVADDSDPNEVGPDEWNAAHTVTLDADELLTSIKTVDGTGSGLDADTVDGNEAAALLARANHTGTQAASTISDFDTEVSNNTDVAANTAARHVAVTVTDSSEINFTLTGQDITAALVAGSIDESKLDTSVNASLDLADSALQSSDIGTSVQAWDAQLDSLSSASANGVSLVTAANYAAMRGLLDLEAGTDFYSISAADAAFATAAQGTLADGSIQGPGSATDNAVVRFDATTGKLAQDSAVIIDDSGNATGFGTISSTVASTFSGVTVVCTDSGASAGPQFVVDRQSSSPAVNDDIGRFVFNGKDSGGAAQNYGIISGLIVDPTAGAEYGAFRLQTVQNATVAERMRVAGGVFHPSATGGDKGNNTINFGAVYDDNSLLTDYVFDKWLGVEQTYSPRVQEKADQLDPAMFSVEAHVTFMRESRRLYGMPDLDDCIDGIVKEKSLGEMVQLLWQSLELAHIHIAELHERLKVVENS